MLNCMLSRLGDEEQTGKVCGRFHDSWSFCSGGEAGGKEVAQDAGVSATFTLGRWRGPSNAAATGKSIHQSASGY